MDFKTFPMACLAVFAITVAPMVAGAQLPEHHDFDKRRAPLLRAPVLEGARAAAAERLRACMGGVEIDLDDVTGAPKFIHNRHGFLSLPSSAREMVPRPIGADPEQIDDEPHGQITAFLDEHADLFGHASEILIGARKTRDYVTEHSGMRTVVWQQELDGIPIFQAMLYGHITKHGELVSLCSQFIPEPVKAAEKGTPNREITLGAPPVSPLQALRTAATNIGEVLRAEEIIPVDYPKEQPDREQRFQAASLLNDATTALVWLPMDRASMRLCWRVVLTGKTSGELYETLIDAVNGEPQVRLCRTSYFQQASFRVFDKDSPTPLSPGWASPNPPLPAQPAFRAQVDKLNVTSTASPNGWLKDGRAETIGNNVDARLDIDNLQPDYDALIDSPSGARPTGTLVGSGRRFWFDANLSQPPKPTPQGSNPASNNQKAAVVNAFYWCNWMHDKLYDLGFTEAAGNFQFDNLGRGGVAGDPVLVDVQQGAEVGLRNQNRMSVLPDDGVAPHLLLQLFGGPTNLSPAEHERDAALTAEVILHEYTHGMNWRLFSRGPGQFGFGLDEGFADFFSLACLSEATDNPALTYPFGGYLARNWQITSSAPRVQANYYYGLLLYPYSTVKGYNPLTFKDVDPGQSAAHTGSSTYSVDPNDAYTGLVKAQQVWGVTLWEMRARLVTNHGFPAGNDLAMRLAVDAMKLMPPYPNFLQARDALLLADRVSNNGNNQTAIWQAFATRGMGARARAGASQLDVEVVEDFEVPSGATWTFTTGQAIYGSPAIGADGTIYIGSDDGKLYAIRADGQKLWEYYEAATYPAFNSPPIVGPDGTIYARRRDGYLYAINPNGTRKWKTFVSYDSYVAPALGRDGTIYVAGLHDLKAISPQGGIMWSFNTGNTIYSSPAIGLDGTIYFGGMDTKVYAVDPTTHQVKDGWPFTTGGSVSSSPAIAPDGTVYIGSHDGKLYALNPNGSKKWDISLGGTIMDSSPAIGPDGTVYVGSTDNKVYSINPVTQQVNPGWPYVTGNSVRCSPAVGLDGTVYVGSDRLYALNPDATLRWYQWTGTAIVRSSPAIGRDGMLYIGSVDGKLYGFQTGTVLARTTWPAFRQNAAHTGTEPVSGEFSYVWQCTSTETPPDCEFIIEGTWKDDGYDLGNQAYHVIGDAYNYGGYLQVTPTGHLSHVWASSTTQTQALQKVVGTDRIAACWYGINSFAIDVKVLDPVTHTLGLYFLDWQGANIRSQRINLYDAHSGFLLDSQTVGSFSKGAYLFWRISGGVRFEFTKLSGDNAVVSGLFLDAN